MWVLLLSGSIHQRAGSRLVPPENLVSANPRTVRSRLVFGIICPCQAREAIPQPAGLAELVLGDQNRPSVRAVDRGAHKPFVLFGRKHKLQLFLIN